MPVWIKQELKVGMVSLHLDDGAVVIEKRNILGSMPVKTDVVSLAPSTRDEANRLSIALRLASKRLEEIGKGL